MLSQAINTPRFLSLALSYLILGPIVERTEWQRTPRAMRCGLCDCRYKILALIVVLFIPALQVAVINIEQQHISEYYLGILECLKATPSPLPLPGLV